MRTGMMDRGLIAVTALVLLLIATPSSSLTSGQGPSLVLGQKNFASDCATLNWGVCNCTTSQSGTCGANSATFDSSGNLWIADHLNHRVLEFVPPFRSGMNATLVVGQPNFSRGLYSAPFSRSGFGPAGFLGVDVALFDSSGNLWVVGFSRVLEFRPPFISGMNASLVIGQKDFVTQNDHDQVYDFAAYCAPNRMAYPDWGAFDSFGNLWIADGLHNRVLEFKPPFTSGMNASLVIGQKDFVHCAPSTSSSGLSGAFGSIAFDPSGNLWVGDSDNNRVLEFVPPFSDGMNASLVIGQKDLTTSPPPSESNFYSCGSDDLGYGCNINFDHSGNLWLTYNNTLLEFRRPFVSGMTINQASFQFGKWLGLSTPSVPSFDSAGDLWIPDFGNSRVLEFTGSQVTNSSSARTASTNMVTSEIHSAPSTVTASQIPSPIDVRLISVAAVVVVVGGVAVFSMKRRKRTETRSAP